MGEEAAERVTMALLYKELGDVRTSVKQDLTDAREEQRQMLTDGLDRLERAIDCIRDGFVTKDSYEIAQAAQDAALDSAVIASEKDREKLWGAIHDNTTDIGTLKAFMWRALGIASVIAAVVGYGFDRLFR